LKKPETNTNPEHKTATDKPGRERATSCDLRLKPSISATEPISHLNYIRRFLEFESLNKSGKIGIVSAISLNVAVERVGIVNINGKFERPKPLLGQGVICL
jgi:hypothetical protein